jgi:hypothetical protein
MVHAHLSGVSLVRGLTCPGSHLSGVSLVRDPLKAVPSVTRDCCLGIIVCTLVRSFEVYNIMPLIPMTHLMNLYITGVDKS